MEGLIPESLNEALDALSKEHLIPVAGGTDLMVRYKRWKNLPPALPYPPLFISQLKELKGIYRENGEIIIKSATELSEIEKSPLVPSILRKAVSQMASPGIRNMGTIGGNIQNASPAGDTLPPLYVLDARVVLLSKNERRCLYIYEFIKGPGKTERLDNEIIYEVRFKIPTHTHEFYRKVGTRKANALSKLSVAALAQLNEDVLEDFRISFGAVAPTPIRRMEIEEKLRGKELSKLDDNLIDEIAHAYEKHINPITDQRSDKTYRKKVTLRLLKAFLYQIRSR